MNRFICMALGLMATSLVAAKLPPLSEEAAAKAAEAKAKTGWSAKVDAYKLCLSQDRVAVRYRQEKGVAVQAADATPACSDPGSYIAAGAVATPTGLAVVTDAATAPKK